LGHWKTQGKIFIMVTIVLRSIAVMNLSSTVLAGFQNSFLFQVFHQNTAQQPGNYYPGPVTHHHQWTVPDTFTMVLDMDQGCLGYLVGDQWLGWAVTGLKAHAPLYPMASTVWGHCEVRPFALKIFPIYMFG